MSDENVIGVEYRETVGKSSSRAIRRRGLVPGIVYGGANASESVSMSRKELDRLLGSGSFFNTLYELQIDKEKQKVLPREVQRHPVTDVPLHIDFLRIKADSRIVISIPVVFEGEADCPGLRAGGVLNVVRHEIEVSCRADSIPEAILANLVGLEIGASLHISSISLPEDVSPTITDRDFTVATIVAPSVALTESSEQEEQDETATSTMDAEESNEDKSNVGDSDG